MLKKSAPFNRRFAGLFQRSVKSKAMDVFTRF
jgi:hypothetical protein